MFSSSTFQRPNPILALAEVVHKSIQDYNIPAGSRVAVTLNMVVGYVDIRSEAVEMSVCDIADKVKFEVTITSDRSTCS